MFYIILEDIIIKLCSGEMDCIFINLEFKVVLEYVDIDSLLFILFIDEMSRCFDIIFSMVFSVI